MGSMNYIAFKNYTAFMNFILNILPIRSPLWSDCIIPFSYISYSLDFIYFVCDFLNSLLSLMFFSIQHIVVEALPVLLISGVLVFDI